MEGHLTDTFKQNVQATVLEQEAHEANMNIKSI